VQGNGIDASGVSNVQVTNGSVTGMGATGIALGLRSRVDRVRAAANAGDGINLKDGSVATDCTAIGNGGKGISASTGAFAKRNVTFSNTGDEPKTFLLYPFVTSQSGFDTAIEIANTTTDPATPGSPHQAGLCNLNFFGANAPSTQTTGTINSGTTFATLVSIIAPNFQRYMIAECHFNLAHGFAFISDIGARNLATSYLAPVIEPGRMQNLPEGLGQ
jgi:hypothetical protein